MLKVLVKSITYQGDNLNQYEVIDPDGGLLPEFEPGAHIDLYFRDGRCRQYSLCGDPEDRTRYLFTVQREGNGRGGSIAVFNLVHVGRMLSISKPRNNFQLDQNAQHTILIGGGIGITPLISMAYTLRRKRRSFELYYCTRNQGVTAFRNELAELAETAEVRIHHDQGHASKGLDFAKVVGSPEKGKHVYYCGPPGFMSAVSEAVSDWTVENVHYELFQVPDEPTPSEIEGKDAISVGFRVKVKSIGQEFNVPEDKSIVEVLRENGVEIPTSCEAGLCKTCIMRVLAGEPDHRDYVLSDEEKKSFILPCCSRSLGTSLTLDFCD